VPLDVSTDCGHDRCAPQSIVKMLEICATWPVHRDCLISALESRFETYGIWGGTTLLERRRALSARGGGYAPDLYGDKANTEDSRACRSALGGLER
jgi:Transcription factor WhiB